MYDTYLLTYLLTRCLTGSQWSCFKTGVMCSCRRTPVIKRAAAFWTACTRRNKLSVMPNRSEFQWSRRLEINAWTRLLVASVDNDLTTGRNCRSRKKPGTANGADLYVVCPSDELVRDGFQQAAAISCRFNNPISRKSWKTRLSLARVTFKPFRSTFTIGK